ncbi:MAG TPA: DUF1559 domain-containing protein [Gemmatales bacterium]|nr:DUF1559 domain-containing protein [Gemmatales bacterium]HMP59485.1 DUF1559 domain-containing protein [Gemmatales bacterium]
MTGRRAFTLPELLVVVGIVAILLSLTVPALQRVRESANRLVCANNLRQMGLALKQYHHDKGRFPPALNSWSGPQPFLSWQARLLPYLSEQALWIETEQAFRVDASFATPPHAPIAGRALEVCLCPSDGRQATDVEPWGMCFGYTFYQGVSGRRPGSGMLYLNSQVRLGDVTDGVSTTLMVGERPPSANQRYGWWYAGIGQSYEGSLDSHLAAEQMNFSVYAPMCPDGPYRFQPGKPNDMCSSFHFWSRHPGGAHFLFVDGSVRFLSYSASSVIPDLATRSGREAVTLPD